MPPGDDVRDDIRDPSQTIAELRRELARYRAERDEAVARETATAEVLGVINSSPGDLAPVFDAMLEKGMQLCEADFAGLWTYDGEHVHPVALHRVPPAYAEFMTRRDQPVSPDNTRARLIRGEPFVHIPDAAALPANPLRRAFVELGGGRAQLAVPLRKDGALIGILTVYRKQPRPFSDKQIALLQNFAAQAVIAMENARLITETRDRARDLQESLEYQTATSNVLQVISRSTFDLQPILQTLVETAARICAADQGVIFRRDDEGYRAAATVGIPPEYNARQLSARPEPGRGTLLGRVVLSGQPVHVADLATDPEYASPQAVSMGMARTGLGVPLLREGEPIGVINLARRRVEPFTERQIELVRNFADQAVIAMENARLITETREALEQQTATAEVLGVINSSPGDLAPVFDAMLERATRQCGAAFGHIMTYANGCFTTVADLGGALARGLSVRPTEGYALHRLMAGEPLVHVAKVFEDPAYQASQPYRDWVEQGGVRAFLLVALRKDDALLGMLGVYSREEKPFTDKQIALLQNFAAQAVIAMENARLITETREALEQQTATAEVLGVINASPGDLAPVFDAMLEKATHLCDVAFGHIWRFDGEFFHPAAARADAGVVEQFLQTKPYRPGPGSPTERLLNGEPFVHIADYQSDEVQPSSLQVRENIRAAGVRTGLLVGLRKDQVLLGAINVFRQEVRPFTDKQIALLQNFAAQAVIAMENARLITETREALAQQTATAEVLGVINSSPGDLAPVFDAMLEKATTLCDAANGQLAIYDGEFFRFVAAHGEAAHIQDLLARGTMLPVSGTTWPRIVAGEHVVHIPDVMESEQYHAGHENTRRFVEVAGGRSLLTVALRKDNVLLGALSVYRRNPQPFTDKQIALLQNFAAQAVIAMENARLITETREALEQQTATAEVLGVINASPGDLAPVFDAILEKAHTLCGVTHGGLVIYDGEYFRLVAERGMPAPFAELVRQPFPARGARQRLVDGAAFVHVADVTARDPADLDDPIPRASDEAGFRTLLMVPLRKDNKLLGYITAHRTEVQPFSDKQIALLQNFAAQAVIAMENARLLGELRQRTDEIAEINRELEARVASQLAELERTGKLRRFLAPQLADLIVAQGDESILETHRREIVVVFCDVRGFTGFAERAEPEEVMAFLRDYHAALGPIVARFEGTLDHYAGDGIMVFFNDPLPTPEPAHRAIEMAAAMREAAQPVLRRWRRHGFDLGFGVGISQGYATLGQIGFAERMDYTAIGTVCNLAARLCGEAKDGQILISRRVAVAVEDSVRLEELGEVSLRGLSQPVAVYNVVERGGDGPAAARGVT